MTVELSTLTTMQVGGPAEHLIEPTTERDLVEVALTAWANDEAVFVLGGGSNVVVADDGFPGTVIRVATNGIARIPAQEGSVRLRVQAGTNWDEFVAYTVDNGFAGLEALSGIPGSVGASPIQNIGAYGSEVAERLVSVDFLDASTLKVRRMAAAELELGYRTSVFKQGLEGVVLSATFELDDATTPEATGGAALSAPVAFPQLAKALDVALGDRVALAEVRSAVLALRSSKGMVLNPEDQDSVSAGSFFTNPIVAENFARSLPADAPRWLIEPEAADLVLPLEAVGSGFVVPEILPAPAATSEPMVKLSAAWLIEKAGLRKGYALPGSQAALSSKHTLAITNRGGATAAEVAQLARFIQDRVLNEFGIMLHPEPVFVGHSLSHE